MSFEWPSFIGTDRAFFLLRILQSLLVYWRRIATIETGVVESNVCKISNMIEACRELLIKIIQSLEPYFSRKNSSNDTFFMEFVEVFAILAPEDTDQIPQEARVAAKAACRRCKLNPAFSVRLKLLNI